MKGPNRQSLEQQRANMAATITRAIDTLHRMQRHLRNPTKNPRPAGGLEPVLKRLAAAQEALAHHDATEPTDHACNP